MNQKIKEDFETLKADFNLQKADDNSFEKFTELHKHYEGFNLDRELFDFDYKSLTATITRYDDGIIRLSNTVDFWDRENVSNEEMYIGNFDIESLED